MAMSTRKKVEIQDKAWLDALKFLMGCQWLKVRFVARQLANVVQVNFSELPRILIDNVKFWQFSTISNATEIVASGIIIPPNEKREWFTKRGINLDAPTDLRHQDVFVGMEAKYRYMHKPSIYYYADVNQLGGVPKTSCSKQKYHENRKPQNSIFSAAFNPDSDDYSWASMEYFLNLLYNPLTYIKEVEMCALNKELTDAMFLGDDYGSYIHCRIFTLVGDHCDSLPWVQKNVRADTIYLPENFTENDNSFKEVSNFLLGTSWICANQTLNVKIEFEWVRHWKWFINNYIKKFRSLITSEHSTPSIEFLFWMCVNEKPSLYVLAWDPEAVKMKPEDSHGAEAAYMISNGRNRMVIAIFKSHDRNLYGKRYYVSIKTYAVQNAQSQETIHLGNDTWLEALKFLSFPQWSKALFVSRQFAGVVQRNISRLPCIVIDCAAMSDFDYRRNIVVFDDEIPENEESQFFTELGISLNAPPNVTHENALIGKNCNSFNDYIGLYLRENMKDDTGTRIFSALFNIGPKHSWASLKYFLKFLSYTSVYTKEVEMFAINQEVIDDLFGAEERFIRCGVFTLKGKPDSTPNMDQCHKSLSWLEQNIRAKTIHFPEHIDYNNENIYEPIANFLLGASWKCASQEVNFKCICDVDSFVNALVQKFQTISLVRNDIPMITASTYKNVETMSILPSDPNVLKLKPQDTKGADVYVISNGGNRMQIEVVKRDFIRRYPNCYWNSVYHANRNWTYQNISKFEVSIKVNAV